MQDVAPKTWYAYLLCDPDTQMPFYVVYQGETRPC